MYEVKKTKARGVKTVGFFLNTGNARSVDTDRNKSTYFKVKLIFSTGLSRLRETLRSGTAGNQ
ncbi:hypothetical protein EH138_20555 [Salmonella enterica subsp. enterica serovar Eastbourne]|uniref:Uncharacterized protein n=1 Tax=Salmonella enterica subsp. enterica serovar Eastbourne TaxID=486993 RepID=A0A702B428_SALET|nr:hypothetical protein [Salmonella enterica subsp. enterica serovar Eastbourne]HAC6674918.1 hypothetical protein [Salmonella enterica subsp. enterica serovar Eastbourne]